MGYTSFPFLNLASALRAKILKLSLYKQGGIVWVVAAWDMVQSVLRYILGNGTV